MDAFGKFIRGKECDKEPLNILLCDECKHKVNEVKYLYDSTIGDFKLLCLDCYKKIMNRKAK